MGVSKYLSFLVRFNILALWAGLFFAGCSPTESKTYRLVYGGDVFLGRGLNRALLNDTAKRDLFGNTAPFFQQADIALINGEGVISTGGRFFNKGEPRPFMFRAHPAVLNVLKDTGIDVVTVGNNHACDYDRDALLEMFHRLRKAGIDYTGAGPAMADARTASFHRLGEITVAVIGVDLTDNHLCAAAVKQAGLLTYDLSGQTASEQTVARDLLGLLSRAERYADLVFLTPHWGMNGKDAPTDVTRRLAARLIHGGYDGIFGHSAHRFQGVELIDGKPVIYDAGNLLDDIGGSPGFLWEIEFTRNGIRKLTGRPLQLSPNRTRLAALPSASHAIRRLQQLSAPFKTAVFEKNELATIYCNPPSTQSAPKRILPPARAVPEQISLAPNDLIRDTLPTDVLPAKVIFPNGMTLVGYKLFADKLFVPKASQVIELFFKTDKPLHKDVEFQFNASLRNGGTDSDRHLPGDWLLPGNQWPVGKIVTDRKMFRLNFSPKGTVDFSFSVYDNGPQVPVESSLPLQNDRNVMLGEAAYQTGAPRIYHYINKITAERSKSPK